MHRYAFTLFTKVFYQCLHKNLALSCGFTCATGKRTRKNWSLLIFLGLSDQPKKIKIHSSAVCLHDFVIKSAYVQPSALFKSSSVFPAVHSSFLISAFSLVSTQFCNSVILFILSWFHFIQIISRHFGLILDHFRSFLVLVTTPNASHAAVSMHISG